MHAKTKSISKRKVNGCPIEVELKLELCPADLTKIMHSTLLRDAQSKTRDLNSVYFDTKDRCLNGAGFSLRIRHVGGKRIQTLKASSASAGLFVRPEWEQPVESDTPLAYIMDDPLVTHVPADVFNRLAPAFCTNINRTTFDIVNGKNQVELALDRGEVKTDQRSQPICEIELELKRGAPVSLFELARKLDSVAPLRLGVQSKSERGYLLVEPSHEKAFRADTIDLDINMSAAEAFQIITRSCIRQFRMNEALLDQLDDPDPLHQARVGLRRLRSALSLFRPMVNDRAFAKLHGELKWLAGSLGTARNIDMLIGRSTDEGVRKAFCSARSGAYHAAHLALGSRRARRTMLDLAEWLALGDWVVRPHDSRLRDESILCRAAEILEKRRKRLKRLGSGLVGLDDESLHKVRIEAKKLRYALDFFGSLYEKKKTARLRVGFTNALQALADRLGDLNDLSIAPEVVVDMGLTTTVRVNFLTDIIDHDSVLKEAQSAFGKLLKSRCFWR